MLAGNQRAALAIMNDCLDRGLDFVGFELHVIQPTLYLIGELWQANKCSVAQEHMATAIAQLVMTIGLLRSVPTALTANRVLLACVEGNHHAVGLHMVADAFTLAGWDVRYLGADVPATALVDEVSQYNPDLVGLSVSFAQQMSIVKTVIVQLRERFGSARPPVMIGGLAINRFEPLAAMVGADSHQPNAKAAVAAADRVVDERGLDARGLPS